MNFQIYQIVGHSCRHFIIFDIRRSFNLKDGESQEIVYDKKREGPTVRHYEAGPDEYLPMVCVGEFMVKSSDFYISDNYGRVVDAQYARLNKSYGRTHIALMKVFIELDDSDAVLYRSYVSTKKQVIEILHDLKGIIA